MSSAHNSDNEEIIPSAPSFCKRIRTDDLQSEVAKSTREGIEQLYQDVVDKLGTNKKDKKDEKDEKEELYKPKKNTTKRKNKNKKKSSLFNIF